MGLGEKGFGVTAKQYEVWGEGSANILKLIVVMDVQLCEYTKRHWIVYVESNVW